MVRGPKLPGATPGGRGIGLGHHSSPLRPLNAVLHSEVLHSELGPVLGCFTSAGQERTALPLRS